MASNGRSGFGGGGCWRLRRVGRAGRSDGRPGRGWAARRASAPVPSASTTPASALVPPRSIATTGALPITVCTTLSHAVTQSPRRPALARKTSESARLARHGFGRAGGRLGVDQVRVQAELRRWRARAVRRARRGLRGRRRTSGAAELPSRTNVRGPLSASAWAEVESRAWHGLEVPAGRVPGVGGVDPDRAVARAGARLVGGMRLREASSMSEPAWAA